jgi:hypothetical protein
MATTRYMKNFTALAVLLWFLCALAAGWFDLFSQSDTPPIYLGLFFALPIVVFTTLYLSNADFRALAKSIDLSLIVGAHVWRYVGIGFLIAFLFGRLPAQFAIPEGLGDIIAAVFALPLALALRRGKPVRGYFIAWNVFGLADLISAITMGVLYSRGPSGILRTEVSTAFMTTFPVNLIPTFFVPLFIMLHALALARRSEVASSATRA